MAELEFLTEHAIGMEKGSAVWVAAAGDTGLYTTVVA